MEGMPNRKERRRLAKEAGYIKMKSKLGLKQQLELSRRASEFGRQIHLANTERILRQEEEKARNLEQKRIEKLVAEGKTPEEALHFLQSENDSKS
jgi:hypothetical protein